MNLKTSNRNAKWNPINLLVGGCQIIANEVSDSISYGDYKLKKLDI